MKRVLITGATGFIGRHCLPSLLRDGYEVHAISSRKPGESLPQVSWHQVDLLAEAQVQAAVARIEPTHLLHLAWYVVPEKFWAAAENVQWVQASLTLVQAFVAHGGTRIVAAGTCAEYDWSYGYCSEGRTPLAPASLYGTCKQGLQAILDGYAREARISSAWGRLFWLYGPYEHTTRLVPSVVCSLLRGVPALCSHGKQIRDFMYVQDAADAFVALLNSDTSGPVNIASGEPLALRDLIGKIAQKTNRQDLIRLNAIASAASEPPLVLANAARLRDEIGWSPNYSLDDGLDATIGWWQERISVAVHLDEGGAA